MALLRYKALAEQLENVNPGQLSHEQKLSFWINLYNALLLHVRPQPIHPPAPASEAGCSSAQGVGTEEGVVGCRRMR